MREKKDFNAILQDPENDDIVLEACFEISYLTDRYSEIVRTDGTAFRNYNIKYNSQEIAERKEIDATVSYGIATAILDSLILYGKVGENFLRKKLEQNGETFSQEDYSRDIATAITSFYPKERKQKIINGVIDALNNNHDNLEANAAKSAIMQDEYNSENRQNDGKMIIKKFLEGHYIDNNKLQKRLLSVHYKTLSEKQQLKNLNLIYKYFTKNYSKIPNDFKAEFKKAFPDMSETRMTCYHIANLHDDEVEKILRAVKKEKNNEER